MLAVVLLLLTIGESLASSSHFGLPVLIYSKSINDQNSIVVGKTLKSYELEDILDQFAADSHVEILIVQHLNNGEMRTELNALRIYDNINFYPSVESPKIAFVNKLPNAKYLEYNSLASALDYLNQKMSAEKPVTVILTGDEIQMRRRRATESDETLTNITYFAYGNECAARLDGAHILDQRNGISGKDLIEFDIKNITLSTQDNTTTLTINFDHWSDLTLNIKKATLMFNRTERFWNFVSGSLSNDTISYQILYMNAPYAMETPIAYSFACTRSKFVLVDPNPALKQAHMKVNFFIDYLQIQPFDTMFDKTSGNCTFGQVNYCQGFFSEGIWMAITASLILLAILAFGVSLLTNISTMDRYDDPKGKPLNIAAEK